MKRQDMTVDQIRSKFRRLQEDSIAFLQKQQEVEIALLEALVTRTRLQEYTERQFNELVQVAREGIDLVMTVKEGESVGPEWIERRNELVGMAQRLIQDTE
jgi:hypothetical protein